jgi:hypothetical protein
MENSNDNKCPNKINLKLFTWNIDFWQRYNKVKNWKENIAKYLLNLDYDFILLQESNPSVIFNNYSDQFEINDKMVYFKKLINDEIGAKDSKKIIPWGNTIIANKKYTFIKDNFLNENGEIENYYFGKSAFMCYDFKLNENDNITIINFYNKNQNGQYPMLKYIISDIEKIVKNKSDNIIFLAGDFNSDIERDPNNKCFFNRLNEIGLFNYTDGAEFETTMVPEIGDERQYPNDKIFVNKYYSSANLICYLIKNTTFEFSDHRPIECIIRHPLDLNTEEGREMFERWFRKTE